MNYVDEIKKMINCDYDESYTSQFDLLNDLYPKITSAIDRIRFDWSMEMKDKLNKQFPDFNFVKYNYDSVIIIKVKDEDITIGRLNLERKYNKELNRDFAKMVFYKTFNKPKIMNMTNCRSHCIELQDGINEINKRLKSSQPKHKKKIRLYTYLRKCSEVTLDTYMTEAKKKYKRELQKYKENERKVNLLFQDLKKMGFIRQDGK